MSFDTGGRAHQLLWDMNVQRREQRLIERRKQRLIDHHKRRWSKLLRNIDGHLQGSGCGSVSLLCLQRPYLRPRVEEFWELTQWLKANDPKYPQD
jgi:hypothetical protein